MNSQLLKCNKFKQDDDKKLWKSKGMLMVIKTGDQRYQIYDDNNLIISYCCQHKTATPT